MLVFYIWECLFSIYLMKSCVYIFGIFYVDKIHKLIDKIIKKRKKNINHRLVLCLKRCKLDIC
jgi:hypothetical protein